MSLGTASVIAGAVVAVSVLALVAYIVKTLGGDVKTALLIGAIIIALSTLLTQLPPIMEAFQPPMSMVEQNRVVTLEPASSVNVAMFR